MKKLIIFLKNEVFLDKKVILSLLGINLLTMIISLLFPYLNFVFIKNLTEDRMTLAVLFLIILSLIILGILNCIFSYFSQVIIVRIERKYHEVIRNKVIMKLYSNDYKKRSMDINYLLSRDIISIDSWLEKILSSLFIEFLEAIFILLILFRIQAKLTLFSVTISTILFLFLKMVSKKLKEVGDQYRCAQKESQKHFLDILDNYAELKVSNLQFEFLNRQIKIWEIQNKYFVKLKRLELFFTIQNAVDKFVLELMFIYLIGGYFVLNGQLNIAELILFSNYYIIFNSLISNMRNYLVEYRSNIEPYLSNLIDYLNTDNILENMDLESIFNIKNSDLSINLNDVHYKNSLGKEIFNSISLNIPFGQSVGIYGNSGSGKTTLLNLIRGKISPNNGNITIGNMDPFKIDSENITKLISYVSQDPLIIDGTIEENLLMMNPDYSSTKIMAACKKGGLSEYIKEGSKGLQKKTGKNGKLLSGGEKQRISFVRAILSDTPIMLLDEPTSALDQDNEKIIVKMLSSYSGEKTIIVVTHREDTLQFVERKIRLEYGSYNES